MQPQVHNQGQQHPIPPANQLQSRQMQGNQQVVSKQQQQPQQNLLQSNQLQSSAMQQHNQPSNNVQQSTQSMLQPHRQVIRHKQQPNTLQRDMWRRLQASGSLTLPQSVLDQRKQLYQSQRPLPKISSTSLDSTTQTGQPNGGDWQEEVYQKIKTMKENYLPDLNELYQKVGTKLQQHDSLAQQLKSDKLEKCKLFKMMLERMISFLQVSKSNIAPSFKEKLGYYEKQIINFININRPRKGKSSLQDPGHLPPQHMHSMSQSHPQVTQVQSLENQINSQMQTTNMQGSVAPVVVLVSSISHAANIGHQQTGCAAAAAQSLAIGTPGISASPLPAEFTGPDGVHGNSFPPTLGKSTVSEQPLERLIKAVKSLTPKALSAAVSDIGSVVSMNDRIVGSAPGNGSKATAGEDLVAMTNCRRLQARNFINQDGTNRTRRMKRCTNATPLNDVSYAGCLNNSIKQLEASDLDSTATCIKKPRIQANHALLEEIREVNQRLIDTVVDISDEEVDPTAAAAAAEGAEGTIVKCSYCAVALSASLKSQYASAQISPIQPLRMLVPTNYPTSSPIFLDKFPVESSMENEDLSAKAKSKFSISLRSLSQPMSLAAIARTWDICARSVISEYAQQSGGGTFSPKY